MANILIIEDEDNVLRFLIDTLSSKHTVTVRTDAADALSELRQRSQMYDLVILDLMLPRGLPTDPNDEVPKVNPEDVGKYIFEKVKALGVSLPTLILTGFYADLNGFRAAMNVDLLMKPVTMAELYAKIDLLLSKAKQQQNEPKP